jgi:hypothetical protein
MERCTSGRGDAAVGYPVIDIDGDLVVVRSAGEYAIHSAVEGELHVVILPHVGAIGYQHVVPDAGGDVQEARRPRRPRCGR